MDYLMTFSEAIEMALADLEAFGDIPTTAMEADNLTTMTQSAKQSAKTDQANNTLKDTTSNNPTQDYASRAKAEGERILKTIAYRNQATERLLNNTWQANENFIKEYNTFSKQYKLVETRSLINWSYGHKAEQYLFSKLESLRSAIQRNASYLNRWQTIPDDALIKKSGRDLDKALVSLMGAPSSIDTLNEFMGHLRSQFRGRKSEKTYRGEITIDYIQDIRRFTKTKTSYAKHSQSVENFAKTAAEICERTMRSNRYIDEDRQKILKYQRNLNRMLATYANMIYFVYRLSVEYIINKRVIITKLYEK